MELYRVALSKGMENVPPRIFFSCHPEDFSLYYEALAGDIAMYCHTTGTILYDADCLEKPTEKDTLLTLNTKKERDDFFMNIQTLVVPVTKRLLSSLSKAMEYEIPFAMAHHIPIIPVVFEEGVEKLYEQSIFSNLHFLSPLSADGDREAYLKKLAKALSRNIFMRDTVERVYEEFKPRIFLSYRKKDRQHAQELIRTIHRDERFRDVGIWYDEYLRENKNFEDSLKEEMEKSSLFLLLVTPRLLEEPNYVMDKEYPSLANLNDIPILPLEMAQTDEGQLRRCYRELPEIVRMYQGEDICEKIGELLGPSLQTERSDDPRHCYLIGLSYLDGIMTEVNRELGIELITYAAENGVSEAEDSLIDLYWNGGVDTDIEKCKELLKKYTTIAVARYKKDPSFENARSLLYRLDISVGIASKDTDIERHEKALKQNAEWAERIFHRHNRTHFLEEYLRSEWGLCDLYLLQGKINKAKKEAQSVLDICERMYMGSLINPKNRKYLVYTSRNRIIVNRKMVEIYLEIDPKHAYFLALECQRLIRKAEKGTVDATNEYTVWLLTASALKRMGEYDKALAAINEAIRLYDETIDPIQVKRESKILKNKVPLLLEKAEILGLSDSKENVQPILDEARGYVQFCCEEPSETEKVSESRFYLIGGEYCLHLYQRKHKQNDTIIAALKTAGEWFDEAERIMFGHMELIKKKFTLNVAYIKLLYDKAYTMFALYKKQRDTEEFDRAEAYVMQAEQLMAEIPEERWNYDSKDLAVKLDELAAEMERVREKIQEKNRALSEELAAFDERFETAKAEDNERVLNEMASYDRLIEAILDFNTALAEKIYQVVEYLYRKHPDSEEYQRRFEEAKYLMGK